MRKITLIVSMVCIGLSFGSNAYADWRSYVWTYEYMTMPKGKFEVEYYLTYEQKEISKSRPNTWKHWVEVEYGITNNLDVSMYQQFKQSNKEDKSTFEYDGFKIRTRYRVAEKNKLPVDIMLYGEYIRDDNFKNPNVLEGKLILAKDIGDFNISYNQILKQKLETGTKTEHEYAAGINYAITPKFKIGVESKGNYTEDKYYIGPTISWAAGKFWVALGAVAGLTEKSDDMQARFLIGIPF